MLPPDLFEALQKELSCSVSNAVRAVSGGSIHHAIRIDTSRGAVFVKYGPRSIAPHFDAECAGLRELARSGAVRTPSVLAVGSSSECAFIALEWIEFGTVTAVSDARLGEQLAQLHRVTAAGFGWDRDNYIGATPQPNAWRQSWIELWQRDRLAHQLELVRVNGGPPRLLAGGERLIERVPTFFSGYTPVPALIHGDLWSGNRAAGAQGQPVLFDPAVYYADREAELAMMHLFGGFHDDLYRAYEMAWRCDAGAGVRRDLYQLYHVLNHLNLFGGAYRSQAERMIQRLLAETAG